MLCEYYIELLSCAAWHYEVWSAGMWQTKLSASVLSTEYVGADGSILACAEQGIE
jgi:hypothetical protein